MFIKMILPKIHFCFEIWMAKNCKNHRFRPVFVTFLHYEFIMANITAVGHISNFIFCSLDMCPNSFSYTKNYQNLSHGLCHPLPGFSMDSLLTCNTLSFHSFNHNNQGLAEWLILVISRPCRVGGSNPNDFIECKLL